MKTLTATEFKARCLAVLDDVSRTGQVVVITKRGKPVARIIPPATSSLAHPQDELRGSITFVRDVVQPARGGDR